jgi:hypothetical protein
MFWYEGKLTTKLGTPAVCKNFYSTYFPEETQGKMIKFILLHLRFYGWNILDSTVTGFRLDDQALILNRAGFFFFLPQCPDQLCVPPSLLSSGYHSSYLEVKRQGSKANC